MMFAVVFLAALSLVSAAGVDKCGDQAATCKWFDTPSADVPEDCFPWVVSIRNAADEHVCAGAVHHDRFIVTAAQCLTSDASAFTVVAGVHSLSASVADSQRYTVERVDIHPDFTGQPEHEFAENNIAVLKLTRDVDFGGNEYSLCLGFANHKLTKQSVVVSGWGDPNEAGYQKDALQFIKQDTADVYYCEACSAGTDFFGSGHDSALYVGKTSESVCVAGPGGPAFALTFKGWQLVGIASRRIQSAPCDADRHPAPLTDIGYHYGWIRQRVTA